MGYMPVSYNEVGRNYNDGASQRPSKRAMWYKQVFRAAVLAVLAFHAAALTIAGKPNLMIKPDKRNTPLQDVVTWDEVCDDFVLCAFPKRTGARRLTIPSSAPCSSMASGCCSTVENSILFDCPFRVYG